MPQTTLLTAAPVPTLLPSQLALFSKEGLHIKRIMSFDPLSVSAILKNEHGRTALGIDLGGTKLAVTPFHVQNGEIVAESAKTVYVHSQEGANYLQFLEDIAKNEEYTNLPVGISYAGPVSGTKVLEWANVRVMMKDMVRKYDGDFARLFPSLKALINDAPAGLIAGAVEAARRKLSTNNVLYLINGTGIGGSVLKGQNVYAFEPGHTQIIPELNPFGQDRACGFYDRKYVCIERVGGGKAGVEDIWHKKTGKHLDGPDISALYMQGDELATRLYDNSALITAHAVQGIANVFELLKSNDTIIIYHGGIFHVPGYAERVQQILEKNLGFAPNYILTKDFSENACAQGAAIAALTTA